MLTFDSNCVHTLNINKLSAFEVLLASYLNGLYLFCSHEFFSALIKCNTRKQICHTYKRFALFEGNYEVSSWEILP